MSQGQQARAPSAPAWPKDTLRIAFGVIWLIDATLKWLPGFRSSYMSVIMGEAQGQPGWLRPWFNFWIRFQHPDAMFLAYLAAVVETLIAVPMSDAPEVYGPPNPSAVPQISRLNAIAER